ncbi:MAG: DUF6326 family protein [Nitriliruptor sp.]|uniref:DUF6326 family protein n=1 Tax=Nitriliruptor sp. TaxID=2448056 RepID=UPI0034A0602C
MHTDMQDDARAIATPAEPQLPVQAKLAAAWTSFMFLYAYVDILGLYLPGVVDDILAGIVWEFDISQAWATGALTLVAIPILMVTLSAPLPMRANRTTNFVVAPVYVLVSAGNALGETWTYYYGLAIGLEVAILALIIRTAWTWPRAVSGG